MDYAVRPATSAWILAAIRPDLVWLLKNKNEQGYAVDHPNHYM